MFYLSKIRNETISIKKVIAEEIQRIKLKLFHLTSILFHISFKGMFPDTVTPKTPIQ
jgi:hypothetical protein